MRADRPRGWADTTAGLSAATANKALESARRDGVIMGMDPADADCSEVRPDPSPGPPPARGGPLEAGLYVVSTPIGNLRDITYRAIDVLAAVDLVLAEDTRVTGKLMAAYGLSRKLAPYHDHNADEARPRVLARLAEGARVALVSDAGTPLISDPGYKLVRAAAAAGHAVRAIPGASAPLAALAAAGLPTDRFLFAGFPPPRSGARRRWLESLAGVRATLILFESGPRLSDSLADMAAVFGPREAVVARELTKLYETLYRGELPRWRSTRRCSRPRARSSCSSRPVRRRPPVTPTRTPR
jgi:16S rRNA (cytidine1402-2'-O)-methyltransferase